MLGEFLVLAESEQARLSKLPRLRRLLAKGPSALLSAPLNQLVDYLSNTGSIYVINLLNQYPFNPTTRNLPAVIATSRALTERISRDLPADDATNQPNHEPGHTT